MFWIADVFIGTNSQDWNHRYSRPDRVTNPTDLDSRKRLPAVTGRRFKRLSDWLYAAHQRRVARRSLNQLNDHLLRDIGISRTDIDTYLITPGFARSQLVDRREIRSRVDADRVSAPAAADVKSDTFTEREKVERIDADESNGTARKAA